MDRLTRSTLFSRHPAGSAFHPRPFIALGETKGSGMGWWNCEVPAQGLGLTHERDKKNEGRRR